ncbi:unnamed protein product [Parnassius apollo]|uniref:(apollo) hypothetical protein n=1 Tax=Parnassius apollo TaxID=110799 RepID=A0A8S3XHQ3_PARAO|nr:unnamed protein product [Parnassius apollo]
MSCLHKEQKPMVPLKTLDIIFRRRYVPNTQYYFTNRQYAMRKNQTKGKICKPFQIPRSEKLLSYVKYSDQLEKNYTNIRLSQPLHMKDNLKSAATRDISERLFINKVLDDVKAVVEIHPEFYSVIEGRPLRSFDDIKVYLNNIRCYAMNRQQIGYRRDLILNIDQSVIEESNEHNIIMKNLKYHIQNFQKFLTEDYKKACQKVTKAEKIYAELNSKQLQFLSYISTLTILNNVIFKLDAIRNTLKIYRRFLMFIAPISWRQLYDETLKDKIQSIQFESGQFATENDLIDTLDIDKIVEMANIEFINPLPAHIYFKEPEQIMYLFRTMELQSREYLIHLSKTNIPFRLLKQRIKQLKQATKHELDYFQFYIDTVNYEITRENYNESHLQEKFFRILNDTFYESVASPDTLKLKICIEYVYEQVFGKSEEGHQSLQDPMKILEVMYEDYNLRLDSLDFKIVNQARNEFFSQDLKTMSNAHKAQRELKAFWEMTNAMNKAFLPPAKFSKPLFVKILSKKDKKANVQRDKSKIQRNEVDKPGKYKLTPDEKDGLILFTEWCEGMDPTPYLNEYYNHVKPVFEYVLRKEK